MTQKAAVTEEVVGFALEWFSLGWFSLQTWRAPPTPNLREEGGVGEGVHALFFFVEVESFNLLLSEENHV